MPNPCLVLAPLLMAAATSAAAPKLHVPSPDWRDQIVYFVLTDRFANGNPRNDDQGAGEFKAGSKSHWNGGDLAGLTARLDYIQGLGATALWITPPVAQLWIDPTVNYTGYHGYWAENFMKVDRHYGTLADYRRLSGALHGRGMFLVQDIVVNHTGNFFWIPPCSTEARPNPAAVPAKPSQAPFDRNDPRDARQRAEAIYHWTPDIVDYNDPVQEATWQMAGLDDLNTENPVVRRALRASYGHWIREAGVDAFRVDTAFYVPPAYFDDFLNAKDPRAPGVLEVARRTGRRDFFVFGEGFAIDKPYADTMARKIERYMTGADGKPLLPGMLNFPLYGAFNDAFARGRPTAELAHRIRSTMALHARPHLMPTFVDNHDVDRFLAGGSSAGLKQALLAMMTLPGIPVVYYGTEQGFTEPRAAMFAAGWASGGRDRYDTTAPLYRYLAAVSALRKAHPALRRGTPQVLKDNPAGAGAIAWRMQHEGETILVAMNTSDDETLLDNLETGAPAGRVLEALFTIDGPLEDRVAGPGGRLSLRLPPRAGHVWRVGTRDAALLPQSPVTLDAAPPAVVGGDFTLSGRARPGATVQLVVDGDLARATRTQADATGRWQAGADTSRFADAATPHAVVAWADGVASEAAPFRVERAWRLAAEAADPAGDDAGPAGRYRYPDDPGYTLRPMDLRALRAYAAGGALRLEIETAAITTSWNPPNGFDHVAFTVFIELPGETSGTTAMPQQNAALPAGMRWQRRLRVHGWSNALFTAEGAGPAADGTPLVPAAAIAVDRERRTVSFTLPASALGNRASLAGARVYVTTWDYDGGYRALTPEPGRGSIGGGQAGDPKVMDDLPPVTLQ